ncbi:MAG: HisA/HisF-related TIM barrel protein [Ornithinimicrobium sp.]|uniref:HisA/HisF-related TIM barrel protein n=1 Tax=Ornithinimicrobium sp. TaxID=1977084 RepID=UPI003D9B1BB9
MTSLTLLPAIDVAGGRAAQVVSGVADPRAIAQAWAQAGATWLHLVDLDRARRTGGDNAAVLTRLVRESPVPVQVSGGIADQESLEVALATGAARVNLASTALLDLEWVWATVRRHGERIAVGIDVQGGAVVARGVDVRIGEVDDVLRSLSGLPAATFVVADASRDGARTGVDADLFREVAQRLGSPVVASGGVRDLGDIRALRALTGSGVTAAILGAALYHGTFTLGEALVAAR